MICPMCESDKVTITNQAEGPYGICLKCHFEDPLNSFRGIRPREEIYRASFVMSVGADALESDDEKFLCSVASQVLCWIQNHKHVETSPFQEILKELLADLDEAQKETDA